MLHSVPFPLHRHLISLLYLTSRYPYQPFHAYAPSSRIPLVLCKPQTDAVDTMSLVRRRGIAFAFEDMPQMPATLAAHNFGPGHAKRAISVPGHSAGDAIEIRRPAAAGLELVGGLVERRIAGSTGLVNYDISISGPPVYICGKWKTIDGM